MEKILAKEMTLEEAREMGIDKWARWSCEPSTFDWTYMQQEAAYIFEGEVVVTADGEDVLINSGMMVSFPKGLNCTWHIKKAVKKAYTYNFRIT